MSKIPDELSRRLFLKLLGTCAATITAAPIQGQASTLLHAGAFWRNRALAPLWVTQVVAKAAFAGGPGELRTTQLVTKAAVSGGSGQLRTTQVVVKVAVRT